LLFLGTNGTWHSVPQSEQVTVVDSSLRSSLEYRELLSSLEYRELLSSLEYRELLSSLEYRELLSSLEYRELLSSLEYLSFPESCGFFCLKQSLQYTGLSVFGTKGTWHSVPQSEQVTVVDSSLLLSLEFRELLSSLEFRNDFEVLLLISLILFPNLFLPVFTSCNSKTINIMNI
jgi:hypothetical protein